MLSKEQLKEVAQLVHDDDAILWHRYDRVKGLSYTGKVQPKQRPRVGKGGRMFTPKETVQFEKAVAEAWPHDVLTYPIRAVLCVFDATKNKDLIAHGALGLIYHDRKDLDNMQKAIFDGLNGVAYRDDKQLVDIHAYRCYHKHEGFSLQLYRCGLSKYEFERYLKFYKALEKG